MWFPSGLPGLTPRSRVTRTWRADRRRTTPAMRLEPLEDRSCPSSYTVTDLGFLPGPQPPYSASYARGINSFGQVAGSSSTGGTSHAFLWTPTAPNGTTGGMTDLGTLGGTTSSAYGVNDFGQVVGVSATAEGIGHAFVWTPTTANGSTGGMTDLGTTSTAFGINGFGQVVGGPSVVGANAHGFVWTPTTAHGTTGSMTDIGTLGGVYSCAHGINDSGQVTGGSFLANGQGHAFRWQSGAMTDLGALNGTGGVSAGYGLNGLGEAVGVSTTSKARVQHAFLGKSGTLTDLGALNSGSGNQGDVVATAFAVNGADQVVGRSRPQGGTSLDPTHAFLWQKKGGMADLNASIPAGSGWTLNDARGITEGGQIVGDGTINGQPHAFLLTPGGTALAAATTAATPAAQTPGRDHVAPPLPEAAARRAAPGNEPGEGQGFAISLDTNAAGRGRFVNPTTAGRAFTTPGDRAEKNRLRLLTPRTHDVGRWRDYDPGEGGVKDEPPQAGTRRTPVAGSLSYDPIVVDPVVLAGMG
jgi:probable HAF family extracellular repeat protein